MNVFGGSRDEVVHELRRRDEHQANEEHRHRAGAEGPEAPSGPNEGTNEDDGKENRDEKELPGPSEPARADGEGREVRSETHRGGWDDQEGRRADRLPRLPTEAVDQKRDVQQPTPDPHATGEKAGRNRGGVHARPPRGRHLRVIVHIHIPRVADPIKDHVGPEREEHDGEERFEEPLVQEERQGEEGPDDRTDQRTPHEGAPEPEVNEALPVMVDHRSARGCNRKREGDWHRHVAPRDSRGQEDGHEEKSSPQPQVRVDERDREHEESLENEDDDVHGAADSPPSDKRSRDLYRGPSVP